VITPAARVSTLLAGLAPLGVVVVVALAFILLAPHAPFSVLDARTIAVHAVLVGIAGLGATLVIISGGLDLSVGSVLALCGVVAALTARMGWPLPLVIFSSLGAGLLCGTYNALLISALRLPAFIATLGTLGFFRGVAKWISDGRTVPAPTLGLDTLMQPTPAVSWLLVAPGVWITLALAACLAWIRSSTAFGRHVVAIGSNEVAARYAGLPIARRRCQVYALAGGLAGLAGLLQFSRLTVGDPTVAIGLELDVIAACVIGGASLRGGTGSIVGTLAGAVLMALLRNRCAAVGWPNFVQEMIVGHIIIGAVALDVLRRRRQP